MSNMDLVVEYLKEYSTPATIEDNGKTVNGRVVNLAALPENIEQAMSKFLGNFNPNKLQLLFITDSGRFIFAKDVEPKSTYDNSGYDSQGIVDFSFAAQPLPVDPRKIF